MNDDKNLMGSCTTLALVFPLLAVGLFFFSVKQSDEAEGCPIVFDLNGNGKIDITGHTSTQEKVYSLFSIGDYVEFDIFADGSPVQIDWIESDQDALLIDLRDGVPAGNLTGAHLFGLIGQNAEGDEEWFNNGFEKLATLDLNSDQKIAGDELIGLALWKDNGDAVFDESELVTLQEAQIVSIPISLSGQSGPYGSEVLATTASLSNGGSMYVEDIWFMTPNDPVEQHLKIGRFFNSIGW